MARKYLSKGLFSPPRYSIFSGDHGLLVSCGFTVFKISAVTLFYIFSEFAVFGERFHGFTVVRFCESFHGFTFFFKSLDGFTVFD